MRNKGITLVALVVTIIILLILAGVTIGAVIGNNGLFTKTKQAVERYQDEQDKEKNSLEKIDAFFENNEKVKVNKPAIKDEMIPIKYNEEKKKWVITNENDEDWYDYSEGKKQWANVMLSDGKYKVSEKNDETKPGHYKDDGTTEVEEKDLGSMFVWIPRYAYQIEKGYHSSEVGTINIKFLEGTSNKAYDGTNKWDNVSGEGNWNIHPAFTSNPEKGGWDRELTGIWIAKFEASQDDAGNNIASYENYTGGTSGVIKIKAGVNSWRNMTIGEIYEKCLSFRTNLNSHLIKNSEWGAVAYLTESIYGKNNEVWINPNSNFITGQAGTEANAASTTETYSYETENGRQASTTGNITGIYDMCGGSWEKVAAYLDNGHENITQYGFSLLNGEIKTKNVYKVGENDTQEENAKANKEIYGSAMWETSSGYTNTTSWYEAWSDYPFELTPFLGRGGVNADVQGNSTAGIFHFGITYGNKYNHEGFRLTLIVNMN